MMENEGDLTLTFQQHICDTVDFHRENHGLTYAAAIGVLAIVQHALLGEITDDEEEGPWKGDDGKEGDHG